MQLRYQKEKEFKEISYWDHRLPGYYDVLASYGLTKTSGIKGIVILESEPQVRTIFTSGVRQMRRIALPYMLYTICYLKMGDKYIYEGIRGTGLRTFFSNKSIKSLSDEVAFSPMDKMSYGIVCTNHEYDYKKYDSLEELILDVISLWWGACHQVDFSRNFKTLDLSEIVKEKWPNLEYFSAQEPLKNKNVNSYLNSFLYGLTWLTPNCAFKFEPEDYEDPLINEKWL